LFGLYQNFPETIHGFASFSFISSSSELQRSILLALHKLNLKKLYKNSVYSYIPLNSEILFEFGIAEDNIFSYLDDTMLSFALKKVSEESCSRLDFICVIRYYRVTPKKRTPLRFDYYLLRLDFQKKNFEARIFHEKGTRRVSTEDLIIIIAETINEVLTQEESEPITLEYDTYTT